MQAGYEPAGEQGESLGQCQAGQAGQRAELYDRLHTDKPQSLWKARLCATGSALGFNQFAHQGALDYNCPSAPEGVIFKREVGNDDSAG